MWLLRSRDGPCRGRHQALSTAPGSGVLHANTVLTSDSWRRCKAISNKVGNSPSVSLAVFRGDLIWAHGAPCRPRTPLRMLRLDAAGSPSGTLYNSGGGNDGAAAAAKAGNPFVRVVFPTALALMLCNMDRICMAVAILPMSKEFGWAPGLQGVIQSAFLWGYMATPILGGILADKYGGKTVMAYGIAWFSLASLLLPMLLTQKVAAMGLALPVVLLARTAVGLGEGVALPCMNNLVSTHVSPGRRSTALGTAFTGFHTGNLLGLFLSPLLLASFGWRALFFWFGAVGGPLLAFWMAVVPEQRRVDVGGSTGQKPAGRISMLTLLSKSATWAIIVVNIVNHWGYFIYLNWMPSYFYCALGVDLKASSLMSFLPWTAMAVGSCSAGLLVDWLLGKGYDCTTVRKGVQTVAFLLPAAALMLLSSQTISPTLAVGCMTAALGITSLGQAGFVANTSDIAPAYAGQLLGLCNTFGTFAGILGSASVGFVVEYTGSFDPVFKFTATLYVLGTLVWNLLCTGEKVFE